jgi:hypothetical protein
MWPSPENPETDQLAHRKPGEDKSNPPSRYIDMREWFCSSERPLYGAYMRSAQVRRWTRVRQKW